MRQLRLGDDIDDFCIKCKRLTNHVIVAFNDAGEPAKVRCCSCYHEHPFLNEERPPKKTAKKAVKKTA